ncbi:MAG: hypothetical protein Q4G68_14570 [Planctomycetia bacterium]|nr:hypothetical protein [Planctomycetia bacterium]
MTPQQGQWTRRGIILLTLVSLLLVNEGCGRKKRPNGLPDLRPCKITVTQNGQPAEGVLVMLAPVEGGTCPWAVTGHTDANGTAVIMTHGEYRGAPEGHYKIFLSKQVIEGCDPASMERPSAKNPMYIYTTIEPQYTSLDTTPLTVQVGRRGARTTCDVGPAVHELLEKITTGP